MVNKECQAFADRVFNVYVDHPQVLNIWNLFDSMRSHRRLNSSDKPPQNLFLVGESGVGKSLVTKQYIMKNPGYTEIDEHGTERDIKPVIWMEMPTPFTELEFYQAMTKALGAPQIKRTTIGDAYRRVLKLLEAQKTEMIFMDETDYILSSKNVKPIQAMEMLKHVSNTANVCLVCIGQKPILELRKKSTQYQRRFSKKILKRFESLDNEFIDFLQEVENQIHPLKSIGLADKEKFYPQILYKISNGRVGIMMLIIQEAYRILGVGSEEFTDFSKAVLTPNLIQAAYSNYMSDDELDSLVS